MAQHKSIHEVSKVIESWSRADFFAHYGCPFLVQISQAGNVLDAEAQQSIVGSKSRRLSLDYLKTKIETQAFLRVNFSIVEGICVPIMNSEANEGRSFIGVGRDPSCDVIIDADGVGTRHGFFKLQPHVTFTHAVAGNSDTRINGKPLQPRTAYPLHNHDVIQFAKGQAFVYLAPHGAYDFFMACAVANSIPEVQVYQ